MLLEKIKISLRIDDDVFDQEISELIEACKIDMELRGISKAKITDTDPIIIRAIKTYCKAEFATEEKEANRYFKSYEMIRDHLSMSMDYKEEVLNED